MADTRILIVEDEALIADHIALVLEDLGYVVAGIADEGRMALDMVRDLSPDLVLLDINLAGPLDGVDVAQEVNRRFPVPIVFVTSNTSERTLERVKVTEPAGFVVKPYTAADLASNVGIALYKARAQRTLAVAPVEEDGFFIKEKHELIRLRYAEVLYAEAMDNYTRLHTLRGRHVLSQTLKLVEQKLEPEGFVRVHRSYLVNLRHVELIAPRHVVVAGGDEVPVSEGQRQALLERISLF